MTNLKNFLLGPFYDAKRFLLGAVAPPPPCRVLAPEGLRAAHAILTEAGCNLNGCQVENLHTWPTTAPPENAFEWLVAWQLWPTSTFLACPTLDEAGTPWFAYRWYGLLPLVKMKLKASRKPRYIIYDLVWGIGAGGYHSFLVGQNQHHQTTVSIYTTFAPTPLFLEGMHDQINYDFYHQLEQASP
jgi:hypothetical protein